jgi:hypothetical protein
MNFSTSPPFLLHRFGQPLEIGVEQADHLGSGKPVGEFGEAAHVGHPHDGVDGFA